MLNYKRITVLNAEGLQIGEDGVLTCTLYCAKPEVMEYFRYLGTAKPTFTREYLSAEELFNPESMKTLQGVSVTDNHPTNGQLLNNVRMEYDTQGFTLSDVREEDGYLAVTGKIFAQNLIDSIITGQKHQLSIGYQCQTVEERGVFEGKQYDRKQTNIKHNHVAVVKVGRNGSDVSIRLNSSDEVMLEKGMKLVKQEEKQKMKVITFNGASHEVSDEVKSAFESMQTTLNTAETEKAKLEAKLSEKEAEITTLNSAKEKLQGEFDAKAEEVTTLNAKQEEFKNEVLATLNSKVSMVLEAKELCGDKIKPEMSETEIMAEVIRLNSPEFSAEGRSKEYLLARYDASLETLKKNGVTPEIKLNATDEMKLNSKPKSLIEMNAELRK